MPPAEPRLPHASTGSDDSDGSDFHTGGDSGTGSHPALPRDLCGAPQEAAPPSPGPRPPPGHVQPTPPGSGLGSWAPTISLSFSAAVCKAHSVTAFPQIGSSVARHRQAAQGHVAVESGVRGTTWPLPPRPPGRGRAAGSRELILPGLCRWDNGIHGTKAVRKPPVSGLAVRGRRRVTVTTSQRTPAVSPLTTETEDRGPPLLTGPR